MDLTLQQIERAELETHRQLEAELEAMVGTAEYEQLDRRARELLTLLRTLEKVRPPSWQAQHEWALRELAQIVIGLGCPAEALDSVTVLHPLCTQHRWQQVIKSWLGRGSQQERPRSPRTSRSRSRQRHMEQMSDLKSAAAFTPHAVNSSRELQVSPRRVSGVTGAAHVTMLTCLFPAVEYDHEAHLRQVAELRKRSEQVIAATPSVLPLQFYSECCGRVYGMLLRKYCRTAVV